MVIIIQIHPQTALSQVNSGNRTSVKALSTVRIERLGYHSGHTALPGYNRTCRITLQWHFKAFGTAVM